MRFSRTIEHSQALTAWKDEPLDSEAEYDALEHLLMLPASTSMEVLSKLYIILERGIDSGWADHFPRYMAQIQFDLINLWRPSVSPNIGAAFSVWAERHVAICRDTIGDDEHDRKLSLAADEAARALMAVPCTAPGDFVVKVYVEQLNECGPLPNIEGNLDWPFLIDENAIEEDSYGRSEAEAKRAIIADIKESDLGRCMMALGRTDFDAETWIKASRRVGKGVRVTLDEDGSRSLYFSDLGGSGIVDMLHRLTAGGLGEVSTQRCGAIADAIVANHPDLVLQVSRTTAAGSAVA